MEMRERKRQKEKKKKARGAIMERKSEEEEEECVGSAPSFKDDSQLSLSSPVTRNEPRLVKRKREKSPPPLLFCYVVAVATKALSSFLPRCRGYGIKKGPDFFWADFQKSSRPRECAFFFLGNNNLQFPQINPENNNQERELQQNLNVRLIENLI